MQCKPWNCCPECRVGLASPSPAPSWLGTHRKWVAVVQSILLTVGFLRGRLNCSIRTCLSLGRTLSRKRNVWKAKLILRVLVNKSVWVRAVYDCVQKYIFLAFSLPQLSTVIQCPTHFPSILEEEIPASFKCISMMSNMLVHWDTIILCEVICTQHVYV